MSTSPTSVTSTFTVEKDFAGRQYVGSRERQEDYYAFSDISDDDAPQTQILLGLGDGLGAHIGGNLASYFLISQFVKAYKRNTLPPGWRLRSALEAANENLYRLSNRFAWDKPPMGSTFVGLSITANTLFWVSVGDSPFYLFREGKLTRLNADHSFAPLLAERVKAGQMTEEEAYSHPDRHVLQSACMGQPLTLVDNRADPFSLQGGDILLAASDGVLTLHGEEIEEILGSEMNSPAGAIADALLFAIRSIDAPRQDNATVAVVKIPSATAE